MTPEQEEKVRGELQDAAGILRANKHFIMPAIFDDIEHRIDTALVALDGEGEAADVWTATYSGDRTWNIRRSNGTILASTFTEADARRIAADHNTRAKLERKAREVVLAYDLHRHSYGRQATEAMERKEKAMEDLRSDLNDEGKP